ncbi:MAG: hypothetical protein ACTSR2_13830 [Candidatus Hodarchaeales archaeon]
MKLVKKENKLIASPTVYLLITILLNVILLILMPVFYSNETGKLMIEILGTIAFLARGGLGIVIGYQWLQKYQQKFFIVSWVDALVINGGLIILLIIITSLIFPSSTEIILFPFVNALLFIGLDFFLVFLMLFGSIFTGEGAFLIVLIAIALAFPITVLYPVIMFWIGTLYGNSQRKLPIKQSSEKFPHYSIVILEYGWIMGVLWWYYSGLNFKDWNIFNQTLTEPVANLLVQIAIFGSIMIVTFFLYLKYFRSRNTNNIINQES